MLIDQLNPVVVVDDEKLPGGLPWVWGPAVACVSKLRYQDLVPAVQALVPSGSTGCQEDFRL